MLETCVKSSSLTGKYINIYSIQKHKTKSNSTFTWEAKWTHTGLRFQTGVIISSVHMTFYFGWVSKRLDILMNICKHFISGSVYMIFSSPKMKFYFCQNHRYEIYIRDDFQTHMRIKSNILGVCAYSFRFG